MIQNLSLAFRALKGPINHPVPKVQWFPELKIPSLEGKTIAITGCTSGTGEVAARTACEKGAKVVLLNRPSDRSEKIFKNLQENGGDVEHVDCDLTSFDSVREAAKRLKDTPIDSLICNAGIMGFPDLKTEDGCEIQMQANHLSHFLLTSLLWPNLQKSEDGRVVCHTSGARDALFKPLQQENLRPGQSWGGDPFPGIAAWQRYQQSKLANMVFHYALFDFAERTSSSVKVLAAHPGPTHTGLQAKAVGSGRWLDNFVNGRAIVNSHATEDGSMGIVTCGLGDSSTLKSGEFYGPAGSNQAGPAVLLPSEYNDTEKYGEESKKLLWEESVRTTNAVWHE